MRAGEREAAAFRRKVLRWYGRHGRKDLPWQRPATAYRVWVSEVMLQQTQVSTVIPYFERFMARFPDVGALARATEDEVMAHWAGLGYYARARNLHRCAKRVVGEYGGALPASLSALQSLPGIGRSTAGAILSQAFHARGVIMDGNVRRVLSRYAAVAGWPGDNAVSKQLWALAERLTPRRRVAEYGQAMMDLGALVCLPRCPRCHVCPLRGSCRALAADMTGQYPGKKPAKALPVKTTRMIICEAGGAVLLEKRPPVGVWGGLWSLPEFDAGLAAKEMTQRLTRRYGVTVQDTVAGASFKHCFTHYRLHIEPWFIRARIDESTRVADLATERQTAWVEPRQLGRFGLPRPAQRLLARRFGAGAEKHRRGIGYNPPQRDMD